MATSVTFDSKVAARTRAASEILHNKELLAIYQRHGGLREDLDAIVSHGQKAEALSHARSSSKSSGESATLTVLTAFSALQKEYAAVMAVVQAVRLDLLQAKAPAELVQAVEHIIRNEAPVLYRQEPSTEGAAGKKRKAVQSVSHEALRAEIHKDAVALLGLTAVHAALKRRGVTTARLGQLRDDAQALSSELGDRATKKGASRGVTESLRAAVADQKAVWSACYRLLATAAQQDTRIHQLLKEATKKR
ncbi:MAG: hypothetical protein KAY55_04485 [Deltaproteobacteria bacterium]|nr:hypothetical protein [Deltaproteobacteria bacterium]